MTDEPRNRFKAAQRSVLDNFGLEAESRFVEVATLEGSAHVLVTGEGPPMVLLNGVGVPAAMWAPLIGRLGGYRSYAVDLPAFGLTDPPPRAPRDLRAHAVVFLEKLLDGLGLGRPTFISSSLGSLWALWLALDLPERVGPMAHVGCPAIILGTSAPIPMRLLSAGFLGWLLMRIQPPSARQVERLSKMVRQHPLQPEIADLILATERLPEFEYVFRSTLRALLRLRGPRLEYALTEAELSRIVQPSLLVFADRDPMGSEKAGRHMAAALPDAEFHLAVGGHSPWLTDTERIARWIDLFLRRTGPRGSSC